MSSLAIILVLLSAFLHALKSLNIKKSLDKQVFLWHYTSLGLLVYFPLFLYFVLQHPPDHREILFWCSLTGLVHFFYTVFLSKAYEDGDLSLVYPIMRSAPAFVLVIAVAFLGETVSVTGLIGIVAVLLGVLLLHMKHWSFLGLFQPFLSIWNCRASRYAFLTTLTVTGYTIIDKLAVGAMHPIVFSYLLAVSTGILFTPYIFLTKSLEQIKTEWKANRRAILLNSVISQGGYLLILVTFTFEQVSYVAAFRQLSIVFAVLMGSHLLKEDARLIRLTSAVIIFVGAFLIASSK